jgi:hypothetical protein
MTFDKTAIESPIPFYGFFLTLAASVGPMPFVLGWESVSHEMGLGGIPPTHYGARAVPALPLHRGKMARILS